jgi:hypothetical protein
MAYTVTNFKTKKALKEAVIADNSTHNLRPIRCFQPGLGPDLSNYTGKVTLEGPHYPKPHTWYAEAWLEDGKVVKIK